MTPYSESLREEASDAHTNTCTAQHRNSPERRNPKRAKLRSKIRHLCSGAEISIVASGHDMRLPDGVLVDVLDRMWMITRILPVEKLDHSQSAPAPRHHEGAWETKPTDVASPERRPTALGLFLSRIALAPTLTRTRIQNDIGGSLPFFRGPACR